MLAQAQVVANPEDPIATLIARGAYREATTACARAYGAVLGRMCMALLGSQSDAEEALQETFAAAHRGMANYRGDAPIKAWLCGIARRQCARQLEKRRKHHKRLELVHRDNNDVPEIALTTKRRARSLLTALDKIKPSERQTLVLRYQMGLSFREIATVCGVEEAAARKRASRGLARLRTLITPEELE